MNRRRSLHQVTLDELLAREKRTITDLTPIIGSRSRLAPLSGVPDMRSVPESTHLPRSGTHSPSEARP